MVDYYITRFNFNASHSVGDDLSRAHSHTFHLAVYVGKLLTGTDNDSIFHIASVEQSIQKYLDKFSGAYLNDMEDICEYGSDIEGLGKFFYKNIKDLMNSLGCEVYQVDVSDNVLHTFQVSDSINLPVLNNVDSSLNYDVILTQKEHVTRMNRR